MVILFFKHFLATALTAGVGFIKMNYGRLLMRRVAEDTVAWTPAMSDSSSTACSPKCQLEILSRGQSDLQTHPHDVCPLCHDSFHIAQERPSISAQHVILGRIPSRRPVVPLTLGVFREFVDIVSLIRNAFVPDKFSSHTHLRADDLGLMNEMTNMAPLSYSDSLSLVYTAAQTDQFVQGVHFLPI